LLRSSPPPFCFLRTAINQIAIAMIEVFGALALLPERIEQTKLKTTPHVGTGTNQNFSRSKLNLSRSTLVWFLRQQIVSFGIEIQGPKVVWAGQNPVSSRLKIPIVAISTVWRKVMEMARALKISPSHFTSSLFFYSVSVQ
jgi:hypothetical protein